MASKKGKPSKKKQSQSSAQKELTRKYNRQIDRIKKLIEEESKLGAISKKVLPEKKPKNITQTTIDNLKKITRQTVISKSEYYVGGKTYKGAQGRAKAYHEKEKLDSITKDLNDMIAQADKDLAEYETNIQAREISKAQREADLKNTSDEDLKRYHEEYLKRERDKAREKLKEELRQEWLESGDTYYLNADGTVNEYLLDLAVDKEIEIREQKTKDWIDEVNNAKPEENDNNVSPKPDKKWKDEHDYSDTPANQTDEVLKRLEEMIEEWQPNPAWSTDLIKDKKRERNTLKNIVDGAIKRDGRDKVAERAEDNASEIIALANEILYESGGTKFDYFNKRDTVRFDLNRIAELLNGRPLDMEESADLTDLSEDDEYEDEEE